ncbi:MAG TPA: GGDEF domain-containing protein [Gaiellaceae bacterium]
MGLVTDQVTGLNVRSKLLADLGEAVAPGSPPSLLALFALDGFKEYEELYGVLEARKLLRRLAGRLEGAVEGFGSCYRPRGDEFAVLVEQTPTVTEVLGASLAALSENHRYYHVVASGGHAALPAEATDPIDALMVADRRLSANAPRRGPRR